jgi:hypothetical protein
MHVMPVSRSMPLLYLLPINTLLKPAMASYIASYTGQHTHCACGTLLDIYGDHFFDTTQNSYSHSLMDICTCMFCPYAISDKIRTASRTYVHVLSLCDLYTFTRYSKNTNENFQKILFLFNSSHNFTPKRNEAKR